MLALLLATALTPTQAAQHQLYLAHNHLVEGDVVAARAALARADRLDPDAELICQGLRLPVQAAGRRAVLCARPRLPEPIEREVRAALARGDRARALALDPWRLSGGPRAVLLAAGDSTGGR